MMRSVLMKSNGWSNAELKELSGNASYIAEYREPLWTVVLNDSNWANKMELMIFIPRTRGAGRPLMKINVKKLSFYNNV